MKQLLSLSIKTSQSLKSIISESAVLFDPFDKTVSRLTYKPDLFNFSLQAEPISELTKQTSSKTWEDCCADRALNLLKYNFDNYWFAYSGGIDSTNMMSSVLKFWPANELKKISVVLSHHSVEENPSFFDKYISRFNLINSLLPISKMLMTNKALLVTGELGDQLFGSDILASGCKVLGDEILSKNYLDYCPQVIDAYTGVKTSGRKIFEHFLPIVSEAPFPIKTTHDFFWWLNFSQKWQHVKYRFYENKDWCLEAKYGSHILHFYDSVDFQRWSLNNHDLKIKNTWKSYKHVAKKFIADFTLDQRQHDLLKIQSLEKTYVLSEKRIAVDSHFRQVNSIEELEAYVRKT